MPIQLPLRVIFDWLYSVIFKVSITMQPTKSLSISAQTAFAQVAEATLAAEHFRTVGSLPGSFTPKTVKGHKYWYYQLTEPSGARRQIFVGPDNEAVRVLVATKSERVIDQNVLALTQAALALGCGAIHPRHFKVLHRLSDYGFFQAGGVLIGTHAFIAYGNMLGVQWSGTDASRTQDIDFAHAGKSISLALASDFKVQTPETIQSLEMGFLPITGMAGKTGGAYLIPNEKEFRLDFLTTVGRSGETPYEHPDLHVTLQPLKFMEFSLQDVQQTALLSTRGVILVNVPHPARYALHKLIVAGERTGAFAVKSGKDIMQAGLILGALRETSPWDVEKAWQDLMERGEGWRSRAQRGLGTLDRMFPSERFSKWFTP
jgi:hypothetical protein